MPSPVKFSRSRIIAIIIAIALTLAAIGFLTLNFARAEPATEIPAPALDAPKAKGPPQKAVLAGGCFWGVEAVFEHVKGVTSVVSGYSGGNRATAMYEVVGTGMSGHAEAVEITFDPAQISYGEILRIYFSVAHDPTQLNYQGPDRGPQYRSNVFYASAEQKRIAKAYIKQLESARVFSTPIVTRIDALSGFYPAEDYHQDFMARHPTYPYIVRYDRPKLENLKRMFPEYLRANPAKA
ncbi:MAG: peptide-methionine (S)-S-oxide reductase MsrA [Alphaproteobacteria bacterium]